MLGTFYFYMNFLFTSDRSLVGVIVVNFQLASSHFFSLCASFLFLFISAVSLLLIYFSHGDLCIFVAVALC